MPSPYRNRMYGIASLNQNKPSSEKPLRYSIYDSSEAKLPHNTPGPGAGPVGQQPILVYHMSTTCVEDIVTHASHRRGRVNQGWVNKRNARYLRDMLNAGVIPPEHCARAKRTIEALG